MSSLIKTLFTREAISSISVFSLVSIKTAVIKGGVVRGVWLGERMMEGE